MKSLRILSAVLLGAYLANSLILTPVINDYISYGEYLKAFFGIIALENTDILEYDAGFWFNALLTGLINIALVVLFVMTLVVKDKTSPAAPNPWAGQYGSAPAGHVPPPPPGQ